MGIGACWLISSNDWHVVLWPSEQRHPEAGQSKGDRQDGGQLDRMTNPELPGCYGRIARLHAGRNNPPPGDHADEPR